MIPTNITKEHILEAIEEVDKRGYNKKTESTRYFVKYNERQYPPKAVISVANKFANNTELDRSKFHGGSQSNSFLISKGFKIVDSSGKSIDGNDHDFAPRLKDHLEKTYSVEIKKGPGRSHLSLGSGSTIHVRGNATTKEKRGVRGFYFLLEQVYKEIINNRNIYFAVVFGSVENTFVFEQNAVKSIFNGVKKSRNSIGVLKPGWHFDIIEYKNGKYSLILPNNNWHDITNHLNNWKQIREFGNLDSEKNSGAKIEPKQWLSLTNNDILRIIDNVIEGQDGKKLEIEEPTINRIIKHLTTGKHVILIGAPGVGKTDLAKRILIETSKLLSVKDHIEAVASYEWGRYEVIGGNSLKQDSSSNNYIFHFGCVTKAY